MQMGSGGASLATARFLRQKMIDQNIHCRFALGGITGQITAMHEEGLIDRILDVQSFDLDAALSLKNNHFHHQIGAKSLVGSYDDGYDYYVFNKDKTYAYYARDLFGEGYNLLRCGTYTQDGEILRLYPDGLSVIMEYTVAWDNGKLVLYLGGNPMVSRVCLLSFWMMAFSSSSVRSSRLSFAFALRAA